jgi:hypothetical protein
MDYVHCTAITILLLFHHWSIKISGQSRTFSSSAAILTDQLRRLPLKVNQVPSGREFQWREPKSCHRAKVRSRVNQIQ